MFAVSLWLIYAGLIHSWVSFAYNAFSIGSIVVGMIKDYMAYKKKYFDVITKRLL